MSLLSLHQTGLKREMDQVASYRKEIAGHTKKISDKEDKYRKAKTASEQARTARAIEHLQHQRLNAERNLNIHQKKADDYRDKIAKDERDEQKKRDELRKRRERDDERSRRAIERQVAGTAAAVYGLHERLSGVENALLGRVRDEIAAEPIDREFDVFLSYATPDEQAARDLYDQLASRNLRVWFSPVTKSLGESLTWQLDRGITASRVGVIFVTQAYLEGRYWTEKEFGAFFSTRKRVIPILDGVDHAALASYSAFLSDLLGLSTQDMDFEEIAEGIASVLSGD
jgi:hypothetical protein